MGTPAGAHHVWARHTRSNVGCCSRCEFGRFLGAQNGSNSHLDANPSSAVKMSAGELRLVAARAWSGLLVWCQFVLTVTRPENQHKQRAHSPVPKNAVHRIRQIRRRNGRKPAQSASQTPKPGILCGVVGTSTTLGPVAGMLGVTGRKDAGWQLMPVGAGASASLRCHPARLRRPGSDFACRVLLVDGLTCKLACRLSLSDNWDDGYDCNHQRLDVD